MHVGTYYFTQNRLPRGVLPYISYIGMVLSRFGQNTGLDFDHFGLKLGVVVKGTKQKRERILTKKYHSI